MTTPTPKTPRPSNADLQAMIEQQAAQIAALLAIASRAAESAPASAQKTKTKDAPAASFEAVRWIDMAKDSRKPWNKSANPKHLCQCARKALVTNDGRPIIDIPVSFYNSSRGLSAGQEIPGYYIKSEALLAMMTHAQLKASELKSVDDSFHYVPK